MAAPTHDANAGIPPLNAVEPQNNVDQNKETQVYNIDNHRNIISLNGNLQTFKTKFTAKSNAEFMGLVADQSTIDSSDNLEYHKSTLTNEGQWFGGEVEYTDVLPKQFYLVLIANEPTEVVVEITREKLEPKLPPQIPTEPAQVPEQEKAKQGMNKWLLIGIILIIGLTIGALIITQNFGKSSGPDLNLDDILQNI
jgi:hypothetical protein